MPADLIQRVNWDLIYPPFAEKCFDLAANCRARGVDYWALAGYRSPEEQLKLWQKGRNAAGAVVEPKSVVTKVKFGAHNLSIAVDWARDADLAKPGLQPSWKSADEYKVLAEEAQELGLEAGYFWKSFQDPPHVQLPLESKGLTFSRLRQVYWVKGLTGVWAELNRYNWG